MDHTKISNFLHGNGTDWLVWIKNTPTARHMSGVWEQQIRSARKILSSLLKTHGRSLNDQALSILMAEVEAVMNSRPLTVELLSNGNSLNPINPSNLLMIKSSYVSSWWIWKSRYLLSLALEKSPTYFRQILKLMAKRVSCDLAAVT